MGSDQSFRHLGALFFGIPADTLEIHTLQAGGWSVRHTDLKDGENSGGQSRILGLEIFDRLRSTAVLAERLDELKSRDVRGSYVAISDRSSVRFVEHAISKRQIGNFTLYGIDPDYYFVLVPVSGRHHRRIERWIVGLKPARSAKARVRRIVKHILIMVGQSKRLYEAFVIVVEGG